MDALCLDCMEKKIMEFYDSRYVAPIFPISKVKFCLDEFRKFLIDFCKKENENAEEA